MFMWKVFLFYWKILVWHMLCTLYCIGKVISNFSCVTQINGINTGMALALGANLLLNPGFPGLSFHVIVGGGLCFSLAQLWGRAYLLGLFSCSKNWRGYLLWEAGTIWHPPIAAVEWRIMLNAGTVGTVPLSWQQDKARVCSFLSSPWPLCWGTKWYLVCMGHMSEFTRGLAFQGFKRSV